MLKQSKGSDEESLSQALNRRNHGSPKFITASDRNDSVNSFEWKLPPSVDIITRTPSTSSLSSKTTNNQQQKLSIIQEGKCLCSQYIRARLRRSGYLNRKVTQRLKSMQEPPSEVIYEVFPTLNTMGEELEKIHPRIYTNISRQLSRAPFGELEDCDTAPKLLNLVAKDLFQSNITWSKVISIFSVCGGFAIDCVRQGHSDYLQFLVEGLADIVEEDNLASWLIDNGGWKGLIQHIRPRNGNFSFLTLLTLFVGVCSTVYAVSNIGCHLYKMWL